MSQSFLKSNASIDGLKSENRKIIEQLCENEFQTVSFWIRKNYGTEEDTKDVFYDAILIVLNKLDSGTLELNCQMSTFFFSICKHLWYHEYRKRTRLSFTDSITDEFEDESYDDTEDRKQNLYLKLYENLDNRSKELFKHVFARKSYSEIARIMNFKNAQAVADKKKNCIKKMAAELLTNAEYKEQLDEISDIYRGNII